jgi:hypothetical protein
MNIDDKIMVFEDVALCCMVIGRYEEMGNHAMVYVPQLEGQGAL